MRLVNQLPALRNAEDHVEPGFERVPPQADGLRRRILPVVVEVHDVGAARVPPAGDDGVVLAEVARMLDERHRHACRLHQRTAHLARGVAAAVVHEDDLVAAGDRQRLDLANDPANRLGAVKQGNDETESD
jgi:hypothetical protein